MKPRDVKWTKVSTDLPWPSGDIIEISGLTITEFRLLVGPRPLTGRQRTRRLWRKRGRR